MGQQTIVSSGVWVSPLETRARPTSGEAVRLRPGDVAFVPLVAGRRLHTFGFIFQDARPLSQLFFRVRKSYWLPGKLAGQLVSVEEFFPLARAAYTSQHGYPIPPDRDLLTWAASVQGVETIDENPRIVNGMYLDVDVVDASGNVVFDWKKKFVDPNILYRGPEEDYVWDSIPLNGLDVAAGWQMRLRPVFPTEGPSADFLPVWNFVGYYLPEASAPTTLRSQQDSWYMPSTGIALPPDLVGKEIAAVILELHDNHGPSRVFLHRGDGKPVTLQEDVKGDRNILGERQLFHIQQPWKLQPGDRIFVGGAAFGQGEGQIEIREVTVFTKEIQGGNTMSPQFVRSFHVDNPSGPRSVELYQGDIFQLANDGQTDLFVISALPGSYASSGVIGALAQLGVSVQQLSYSPEADYRPATPCWISRPIQGSPLHGRRILVYEPNSNPNPLLDDRIWRISSIYNAARQFYHGKPLRMALPLVCTGTGQADYRLITRMLVCEAINYAGGRSVPFQSVKIVNYSPAWANDVRAIFDEIKTTYEGLGVHNNLPLLPSGFQQYSETAFGVINAKNLSHPTRKQAWALSLYTTNYYGVIDAPLRTQPDTKPRPNPADPGFQRLQPYYALLDAALANLLPHQGSLVYRGVGSLPPSVTQSYQNVQGTHTEYEYTSTSHNKQIAKQFGDTHFFHINPILGKPVAAYSAYPEGEVLFGRAMMTRTKQIQPNPTYTKFEYFVDELMGVSW
jgi:hypothetical protein